MTATVIPFRPRPHVPPGAPSGEADAGTLDKERLRAELAAALGTILRPLAKMASWPSYGKPADGL